MPGDGEREQLDYFMLRTLNVEKELDRDYQKIYYNKLKANTDKPLHSLVCIPTGGGKTRLAVVYSVNQVIARGKKVLWMAHSQFLLNQAYDTFEHYLDSDWMKENAILIHSGEHDKARDTAALTENHKIVICSFQSLLHAKEDWKRILGEQVVVIVDEAHHLVASSYHRLLDESYIGNKTVIGLTATPIRMKNGESQALYQIFRDDLQVPVHMLDLLEAGYLVEPIFETVSYRTEESEQSELNSIDEVDRYLVENSEDYNKTILEKYWQNKKKYGKTVIFAINKAHADSLCTLFRKAYKEAYGEAYGEKNVFLVYSGLPDREKQFQEFKKSKKGILINVNVLNEGVDIPDIQTIFMTKSLNSKTAVTQIIGRALRTSENKKCAYIVNFAVSNVGRKLLLAMPDIAYKQYLKEWEEAEEEKNAERISRLRKMVENARKKGAKCSFSAIVLAGHYTILGETGEIRVPVNYQEYRKIKSFLSDSSNCPFPKKLFFCESDHGALQNAFREKEQYKISFRPYQKKLLNWIDPFYYKASQKVNEILEQDKPLQECYRAWLGEQYRELRREDPENAAIQEYFDQIGISGESDFISLMWQEFPILRREKEAESK